ncbi:MAG: hypothetical protein JSR60_15865 [Proteobacteria bacterium]|nr:hypothetical protein [Pseudomonadota bacterium]
MGYFLAISWVATTLACCVAAVLFIDGLRHADSSPKQAAAAGIAIAIVVIPYVFTRGVEAIAEALHRK